MRLKYKQNWINHLERMDNTRLPKYTLTYKLRGRRGRGRPRKRWHRVDAGTGQRPNPWRKKKKKKNKKKKKKKMMMINTVGKT